MKRTIQKLGYVHMYSEDPRASADFIKDLFGWEITEGQEGQLNVAVDKFDHRMSIYKREQSGIKAMGWQVLNRSAFLETKKLLENANVPYVMGTESQCQERGVTAFLSFTDPAGVTSEVSYAPNVTRPAVKSIGRLDVMDLVHITLFLPVEKYQPTLEFYQDVLGFEISDTATFGTQAAFTRCSENHHNLAFVAYPAPEVKVDHIMFEVGKLDDVMSTFYRVKDLGIKIMGPGQHGNCKTKHIYVNIPAMGDTNIEIGYDHMKIPEDSRWEVVNFECDGFDGFMVDVINSWMK